MEGFEKEWSIQKRLTASWLGSEPVELAGEQFFLAAWEVMTNYEVNDSRRRWNAPSIDFVFLDREGRLLLVELKRSVQTPRDGWTAVCQVSHRAQALGARYSADRLEHVYLDCHSGLDGRTARSQIVQPLLRAHAAAFGQAPLERLPALPVRRMVMAERFGPPFSDVLSVVNTGNHKKVAEVLSRYKRTGEIKRFLDLPLDVAVVDESPIVAVTTDGARWLGASSS